MRVAESATFESAVGRFLRLRARDFRQGEGSVRPGPRRAASKGATARRVASELLTFQPPERRAGLRDRRRAGRAASVGRASRTPTMADGSDRKLPIRYLAQARLSDVVTTRAAHALGDGRSEVGMVLTAAVFGAVDRRVTGATRIESGSRILTEQCRSGDVTARVTKQQTDRHTGHDGSSQHALLGSESEKTHTACFSRFAGGRVSKNSAERHQFGQRVSSESRVGHGTCGRTAWWRDSCAAGSAD